MRHFVTMNIIFYLQLSCSCILLNKKDKEDYFYANKYLLITVVQSVQTCQKMVSH